MEQIVTPWEVKGNINYKKLVEEFGTEYITNDHIDRIRRLTGMNPHPFLRRHHFFSHRALDDFLDAYENGESVFLYTGRGPTSESLHLGHTIPFLFTVWLQKAFRCPVVIQMADDEKYAFKDMPFKTIYQLGFENAKDIIAFGFDPELTFIFSNRDYRLNTTEYEIFVSEMKTKISSKEVSRIFGFDRNSIITEFDLKNIFKLDTDENIYPEKLLSIFGLSEKESISLEDIYSLFGIKKETSSTVAMYDWPFYQSAAAFSKSFPHIFGDKKAHCLVAYAIDQDPYFRMARDVAEKMNLIKPYSIMCQFIPPLTGVNGKMSSSVGASSSIFLTDTREVIRNKVMTYAFSGSKGNGSLEDHYKYGGDPDIDISYQYLTYFEEDDDKLREIYNKFTSGDKDMTCSSLKNILVDKIVDLVTTHQEKRKEAEQQLEYFYSKHPMNILCNPSFIPNIQENEAKLYSLLNDNSIKYTTKYHKYIETMEQGKKIAASLNGTVCKNLFMKNGDNFYIIITNFDTNVNVKQLSKSLEVKNMKFVPNDEMVKLLNVPIGCVSPFSLINCNADFIKNLNIVLYNLEESEYVNFHPLRNDATTTISFDDFKRFIELFKLVPLIVTN